MRTCNLQASVEIKCEKRHVSYAGNEYINLCHSRLTWFKASLIITHPASSPSSTNHPFPDNPIKAQSSNMSEQNVGEYIISHCSTLPAMSTVLITIFLEQAPSSPSLPHRMTADFGRPSRSSSSRTSPLETSPAAKVLIGALGR